MPYKLSEDPQRNPDAMAFYAAKGIFPVFVLREHTEGRITEPVAARLRRLIKTRGFRNVAGRVCINWSGYADDPREVWQIPEIRAYFAALADALDPELPALLGVVPEVRYNGPTLWVTLRGTVDAALHKPEEARFLTHVRDGAEWIAAGERRILHAYAKYHLPPSEAQARAREFRERALMRL